MVLQHSLTCVLMVFQVEKRVDAMKADMEKRMIAEIERQRLAELNAQKEREVRMDFMVMTQWYIVVCQQVICYDVSHWE